MTTSADRTATESTSEPAPTADSDVAVGNSTARRASAPESGATDRDTSSPDTNAPAANNATRDLGRRIVARFGAATVAFTIVVAVFGALFAWITPPFWGHDEITQFGRAYQVAHGGFLPERIHDDRGISYGGDVSSSITVLMGYALHDYTTNPEEPDPMVADPGSYARLEGAGVSKTEEPVWFTNTAAYSPVPYTPAAVGIRVAELFGLNVGAMMLLTRLAGLAAYLALVGFGLYALRAYRVQWLAFTVAVLPIAVFQAGTVTADTMTNALAILVSVLLVKALFLGDGLGRVETAALLAATVALPVSKPTYVLLAMLVVLVPTNRFAFGGDAGWKRLLPWGFAALGAVAFAVWMKIAAPTTDGMGLMRPQHQWNSVRPSDQLHGILSDPVNFVNVFGESIALRDERWFSQFFGELGFAYIDVPALSMLACLLAFAVSIGIADRMNAATATFRRTLIVALTVLASVAMIYVTLYMSFTPVDYYIIDGVQGRYFVPLAIVALVVLLRWIPLRLTDVAGKTPTKGPAITIIAATLVALIAALWKYYSIVWG
ncbi:DUF2142 domain-containing protein [Nocardia sp. NBC_00565]|uniref:DUF2142 domain-containing protein n=1 Tax=Nocardia sp. NBC_00565 TaxID=2975993 RepID=UPI002E81074E|nr:DUF2142 domain-containing protein [Nocardia sp. NBC_00565]WUC01812.1 DUF2142 domain-containing protein [Nocardia sp. NBC_00565]